MSNLNYPLSLIRFKRFFSLKQFFPCTSSLSLPVCLIWPPQVSYSAWQNSLMSYLWFVGKKKNPVCQKKKKKYLWTRCLQAKTQQKIEIISHQTKTIIDKLQSCESTHHEDIKLALITMLKQFCERKNISQHIAQASTSLKNYGTIAWPSC